MSQRTIDLPLAASLADVLGNEDVGGGSLRSARLPMAALAAQIGGRQRLTANTIIPVGPGQDFATLQAAWDDASANIDTAGFELKFKLIAGTHAGVEDRKTIVGGGRVVIEGVEGASGTVIVQDGVGLGSVHIGQTEVTVQHFEVRATGVTSEWGLAAPWNGVIRFGLGMRLGACVGEQMHASSSGQINTLGNPYSIVAGAGKHLFAGQGGQARTLGSTVTLSGTPAFSEAFAYAGGGGIVDARGATFSGPATGKRFIGEPAGIILRDTNNLEDLPGNVAGTLGVGALYDEIAGPTPQVISGSFPATPTLDIAIPVWAKRLGIGVAGLSSNTASRHPIVLASTDGGSTWLDPFVTGIVNDGLEDGGGLVNMFTDVAAARSWNFDAVVDGVRGGGVTSQFVGVTDDFSVVVQMGLLTNAGADFAGRITHIRFAWSGSGNFDGGGTYSVRATG